MKDYKIDEFAAAIRANSVPIVLFGAGRYGKIAQYALQQLGISATCFCDSDPLKHGTTFCGLPVISHEGLAAMGPECHVFISCNYIAPVVFAVQAMNFPNLYHCIGLLEAVDFAGSAPTFADGFGQVNILLAEATPTGEQPIIIAVGGISSPSTATLAVAP